MSSPFICSLSKASLYSLRFIPSRSRTISPLSRVFRNNKLSTKFVFNLGSGAGDTLCTVSDDFGVENSTPPSGGPSGRNLLLAFATGGLGVHDVTLVIPISSEGDSFLSSVMAGIEVEDSVIPFGIPTELISLRDLLLGFTFGSVDEECAVISSPVAVGLSATYSLDSFDVLDDFGKLTCM